MAGDESKTEGTELYPQWSDEMIPVNMSTSAGASVAYVMGEGRGKFEAVTVGCMT